MKVKLARTLFVNGSRFRAGIVDLPEGTPLPKGAVNLDPKLVAEEKKKASDKEPDLKL